MAQITWTETEPGSDTWHGTLNDQLWFTITPGFYNQFWIETRFPCTVPRIGSTTGSQTARARCQGMVDDFVALLPTLAP